MEDTLTFAIYDKAGTFKRQFSGVEATLDLAGNVIPTATFVLDDDDPALPAVVANGARAAVMFRGVERCRGLIRETPGTGPEGRVTAHVVGDLRKLWQWQGRPVPSAAVGAQTQAYRTYTGPAETVFKNALAENFARLGVPWTVAPSLGRGSTTRAELRFHPLADKVLDALTANDLVVTLSYVGGGVVVDVREARTVPGVFTVASGVPDEFTFARKAPSATRIIVGGRGEGVEREFVEVRDTALEADWNDIIEGFVDARNTDEGSDITIDGQEALAEGRPTSGLTTTLNETDRFRYGTTYTEGDLVRVRVGPIDHVQPVSVSITETAEDGLVVTPHIGDIEDDTDAVLARQVARLARGVRDTGRR